MDDKIRNLVDQLPDKAPRSKLEPHTELISALRRKRYTYQEIARFLKEHVPCRWRRAQSTISSGSADGMGKRRAIPPRNSRSLTGVFMRKSPRSRAAPPAAPEQAAFCLRR